MGARHDIAFEKWHGLENDYVILQHRAAAGLSVSELARSICDRRTGVGADGLLLVEARDRDEVAFQIVNSDGSSAELCGNGLRCAAAAHVRAGGGDRLTLRSVIGAHHATVRPDEDSFDVAVDLVPVLLGEEMIIPWRGGTLAARMVSTGNPHAVIVVSGDDDDAIDDMFEAAMTALGGRVNVHIVKVSQPGRLRMWSHERGAGAVRACATGAAAAVGVVATGESTSWDVQMPGGVLQVAPGTSDTPARTRGPATFVCDGVWSCPGDVYAREGA
ncbi:MAG: diaminopimelate epimerase [Phycisphaerales bacterium]|jgi:diaminopimelate epimerase|nr:diaminopimelate epimerase [Phycisphaerales bacterium]